MPREYNKSNQIVADHGDWIEVDVSTGKYPNTLMKIDKDYWDAISTSNKYRCYAMDVGRRGVYVSTTYRGKTTFLHRIIMGAESVTIKHINNDGLDNRRENLRRAIPR